MRLFHRDERGQSVVLLAGALPLMLALLLLVVDGGRLYVERERIRNAAQLAAEAAVSLAADRPGKSQPTDAEFRGIVAEALSRNLPGEVYTHTVAIPFRSDVTTFNVKVHVARRFTSSIAQIGFDIGADAAAKLGEQGGTPGQASTRPLVRDLCYSVQWTAPDLYNGVLRYHPPYVASVLIDGSAVPSVSAQPGTPHDLTVVLTLTNPDLVPLVAPADREQIVARDRVILSGAQVTRTYSSDFRNSTTMACFPGSYCLNYSVTVQLTPRAC